MENTEKTKKPNKGLTMALIGVILVIAIIVIAVALNKNGNNNLPNDLNNQENQPQTSENVEGEDGPTNAATDVNSTGDLVEVQVPNAGTAKVVVPGANPITSDNIVVTEKGTAAQSDAQVMSENAPRQTGFLNRDELGEAVVKLNVGNNSISPSTFTTSVGAPTTFSITGVDSFSHVIAFDDPIMTAIAILVGPNQTKAITFQAPSVAGTYAFKCVSPGHEGQGEVGQMIVE